MYAVFSYKHFLITVNYFWRLYTIFGGHILLSTAIYHFRRSYTTFDGYILLLTAIYCISRLYTTFDGYTLLLALPYRDFARIKVFPTISFIWGINTGLDFNINLLVLIQFYFFCSSMVAPTNFNFRFWKRCFIRNAKMLKMWNYQALKKMDIDIFNWIKTCYINCNVP